MTDSFKGYCILRQSQRLQSIRYALSLFSLCMLMPKSVGLWRYWSSKLPKYRKASIRLKWRLKWSLEDRFCFLLLYISSLEMGMFYYLTPFISCIRPTRTSSPSLHMLKSQYCCNSPLIVACLQFKADHSSLQVWTRVTLLSFSSYILTCRHDQKATIVTISEKREMCYVVEKNNCSALLQAVAKVPTLKEIAEWAAK